MKAKFSKIEYIVCFLILLTLPHNLFALHCFDLKENIDSVYIIKSTLNKKENSLNYILVYKTGSNCYEVYRTRIVDYNGEVKYNFSYSDNSKTYTCYTDYDFATGVKRSFFYNKKNNSFYMTDLYDLKAIGDKIIKKTVDFEKHSLRVKSIDNGKVTYYSVKLKEIKLKNSSRCP